MNKLNWWEISFYASEVGVVVKCQIVASSFDEALAKARKIDPRFDTGRVMGWKGDP